MVEVSELRKEFDFMGIVDLDNDVLFKCVNICSAYEIDAERLVEEWVAFAQTNLKGNLQPTIVTLETLVRKQLEKRQEKNKAKKESEIYDASTGVKTTKSGAATPKIQPQKKEQNTNDNGTTVTNNSFSDIPTPVSTYSMRNDRGEVLETFGVSSTNFSTKKGQVSVKLLPELDVWNSDWKYMFERPNVEEYAVNERIDQLGQILMKKYNLKSTTAEETNSELMVVYGRIRSDGDGRLNSSSILLETSRDHRNGQVFLLNLKNVSRFAFFPGQIVAVEGALQTNNSRQSVLTVARLYSDAAPEVVENLPNMGALHVVVACGPFTMADNFSYEPLTDLVKYVLEQRPQVLLLLGPFVDVRHSFVTDGLLDVSFREHFHWMLEEILGPLRDTNTQVVLMSSHLDAHHHSVYPTPPFPPEHKHQRSASAKSFLMVPDPAILDIDGLLIGATGVDVLFHLARTEFNCQPNIVDRMARFATHIMAQRCFYPLYPAQAATTGNYRLPVDQKMLNKSATFGALPHVLIAPSNLKHFVKNINGCIVINPERVSKGLVGGTFASVEVSRNENGTSMAENVCCRIIKI